MENPPFFPDDANILEIIDQNIPGYHRVTKSDAFQEHFDDEVLCLHRNCPHRHRSGSAPPGVSNSAVTKPATFTMDVNDSQLTDDFQQLYSDWQQSISLMASDDEDLDMEILSNRPPRQRTESNASSMNVSNSYTNGLMETGFFSNQMLSESHEQLIPEDNKWNSWHTQVSTDEPPALVKIGRSICDDQFDRNRQIPKMDDGVGHVPMDLKPIKLRIQRLASFKKSDRLLTYRVMETQGEEVGNPMESSSEEEEVEVENLEYSLEEQTVWHADPTLLPIWTPIVGSKDRTTNVCRVGVQDLSASERVLTCRNGGSVPPRGSGTKVAKIREEVFTKIRDSLPREVIEKIEATARRKSTALVPCQQPVLLRKDGRKRICRTEKISSSGSVQRGKKVVSKMEVTGQTERLAQPKDMPGLIRLPVTPMVMPMPLMAFMPVPPMFSISTQDSLVRTMEVQVPVPNDHDYCFDTRNKAQLRAKTSNNQVYDKLPEYYTALAPIRGSCKQRGGHGQYDNIGTSKRPKDCQVESGDISACRKRRIRVQEVEEVKQKSYETGEYSKLPAYITDGYNGKKLPSLTPPTESTVIGVEKNKSHPQKEGGLVEAVTKIIESWKAKSRSEQCSNMSQPPELVNETAVAATFNNTAILDVAKSDDCTDINVAKDDEENAEPVAKKRRLKLSEYRQRFDASQGDTPDSLGGRSGTGDLLALARIKLEELKREEGEEMAAENAKELKKESLKDVVKEKPNFVVKHQEEVSNPEVQSIAKQPVTVPTRADALFVPLDTIVCPAISEKIEISQVAAQEVSMSEVLFQKALMTPVSTQKVSMLQEVSQKASMAQVTIHNLSNLSQILPQKTSMAEIATEKLSLPHSPSQKHEPKMLVQRRVDQTLVMPQAITLPFTPKPQVKGAVFRATSQARSLSLNENQPAISPRKSRKHCSYRSRHTSSSSHSSSPTQVTRQRYRHRSRWSRSSSRSSQSRSSSARSRSPMRRNRMHSGSSSRSGERRRRRSEEDDSPHSSGSRCYSRSYSRSDNGTRMRSSSRYSCNDSSQRRIEVEDRRVVYVGGITEGMTRAELRERFERFGEVVEVTLHFRDRGDNYGFVTFCNRRDAFDAIERGNDDPLLPRYELCFGGRREFCRRNYADLDALDEDDPSMPIPQPFASHVPMTQKTIPKGVGGGTLDFDALLQQALTSRR